MDEFNSLMRTITDAQLRAMGLPPLPVDPSNAPIQRDSPLWHRLKLGGWDDERRRLDALDWPAAGKDYGRDPVYKDRNGVLRVDELEP